MQFSGPFTDDRQMLPRILPSVDGHRALADTRLIEPV